MLSYGQDTLRSRRTLQVDDSYYDYYSLDAVGDTQRLPYTLRIVLENLLRFENGKEVTTADVESVVKWQKTCHSDHEISYRPSRILMQDFTGVPAIVDLAAMRDAVSAAGGNPQKVNPLIPVDLVIDHSLVVDDFGSPASAKINMDWEFQRNIERYTLLRWGQSAFKNFQVVPPGTGICHQVNLEYLARCVWIERHDNIQIAYPETIVGTDSHTTMINCLAVLGWGVGGIEAEAVMLGQAISMLIPDVIGVRLYGSLREGVFATDLVLTLTQMLRQKGVVGKFVEFSGPGLAMLSLPDRATISNMAPEYGATCSFFPVDRETIDYLIFTGRNPHQVKLIESYAKVQGIWCDSNSSLDLAFTDTLELDLSIIESSLAGPYRPQDRVSLSEVQSTFLRQLSEPLLNSAKKVQVIGESYTISDGDILIAAITSCTNTSNPSVLVAAGLLARKAVNYGLTTKCWVKTSFAPGSQVASDYLIASGLQLYLDQLGFYLVGYGCTTCIGNAGPIHAPLVDAIHSGNLVTVSILSGNRNFEGRISSYTHANYLASPPLVVAYALVGSINIDITKDPLGTSSNGRSVFLRDIWPTRDEIQDILRQFLTPVMFSTRYANVFTGSQEWQEITVSPKVTYDWDSSSTYVRPPPYFLYDRFSPVSDVTHARCLVLLGDSVTTDHISPAGAIPKDSLAGLYLQDHGVNASHFNSYGSRRGNHEIMMRGTFANPRIHNKMLPNNMEGGVTRHEPSRVVMTIYEAAMLYKKENVPLVIIAGKEYGTGSSRDWAAKGPALLGVKAVIAESFERIHRSNLIGMGLLPLQFRKGECYKHFCLNGSEQFDIIGLEGLQPLQELTIVVRRVDGSVTTFATLCRIETAEEIEYYFQGGIMPFIVNRLIEKTT